MEDDALVEAVYEAQGERHEQSRTLGRPQTPAEVALAHADPEARAQMELRNAGA
jgi:hypothetical protein